MIEEVELVDGGIRWRRRAGAASFTQVIPFSVIEVSAGLIADAFEQSARLAKVEAGDRGRVRFLNDQAHRARTIHPDMPRGRLHRASITLHATRPELCEHANEVPARCPCDDGCYCKAHTCLRAPS